MPTPFSPAHRGSLAPSRITAATRIPRKVITDKLGIPADATDAEALAALDAKLAARGDDALYRSIYGSSDQTSQPTAAVASDALYARTFGA